MRSSTSQLRRALRFLICAILLAGIGCSVAAEILLQETRLDDGIPQSLIGSLDVSIRGLLSSQPIPGLLVGFRFGTGETGILAYGHSDRETEAPMSVDGAFYIGSTTKAMTAVAVMQAADRGEIDLDVSVRDYLPACPAAWEAVTLRHLLAHTSGIPAYILTEEGQALRWTSGTVTLSQILDIIAERPMDFAPGAGWNYTNTNFFLLGHVLESALGVDYADIMATNLFGPLGLARTSYDERSRPAGLATAYYLPDEPAAQFEIYPLPNVSLVHGAGGISSGVDDLLGFLPGVFAGDLLSDATLAAMTDPANTALSLPTAEKYGLGCMVWREGRDGLPSRVGHLGTIHGHLTLMQYFPEHGLSLVLYSNSYDLLRALNPSRPAGALRAPTALHVDIADILLEYLGWGDGT